MRLPFETKDVTLNFKFNILECYNLMLQNLNFNLKKEQNKNLIIKSDFTFDNWNDWMREVIWYGHRSGRYICRATNGQIKSNYESNNGKSSNVIGGSYIG